MLTKLNGDMVTRLYGYPRELSTGFGLCVVL